MWLDRSATSHLRRCPSLVGGLLVGLSTLVCLRTTRAFHLPAATAPSTCRQISRALASGPPCHLPRPSPTALFGGSPALEGDGRTAQLPLSIYIEHTDRYQVVYNANYVKFLVRALRHAWPLRDSVLVGMGNVRFKAPARLGDHVIVHTTHVTTTPLKDSGRAKSSFVQEIRCQEDPKRVFFAADLTMTHHASSSDTDSIQDSRRATSTEKLPIVPSGDAQELQPSPDMIEVAAAPSVRFSTHVWADEMDVGGGGGGVLAPHHVLAYFERARTHALGGPGVLESLVSEEGVMFVVAKIEQYWFDGGHGGLRDGEEVQVVGRFKARGSAIIECQQVLVDGGGSVLAHASVTLACLDAKTNRMSKVPPNVLTLLAAA